MPDPVSIRLTRGYFLASFGRLLKDLQPLLDVEEPSQISIDMSDLTFMGPAALATTAAAILRSVDGEYLEEGSSILLPRSLNIRRYLDRMNFLDVAIHELGGFQGVRHNEAAALLECQHFTSDEQLRPIVAGMLNVLGEKVALTNASRAALDSTLSEVLENVLFHADAPHGGVVAVQAFGKGEIELAIVDLGVGIAGSLAKNSDYADEARAGDLEAIRTAIRPRVTSTPWRNAGLGLAYTTELMRINGGQLMVRSGQGVIGRGAKEISRTADERLPGTLVALRVKSSGPIDDLAAWNALDQAGDTVVDDLHGDDGGDIGESA